MSRNGFAAWRRAAQVVVGLLAVLGGTAAQAGGGGPDRLAFVFETASVAPRVALDRLLAAPPIDEGPEVYDRAWLAAQPAAEGDDEWRCLAEALYFEARGESVAGMVAVGEVILNRAERGDYPRTVCGVVTQGTGRLHACQFSYTCDGAAETIHEPVAWEAVGKVARALLDGAPRTLTDGATHYHTRAVRPSWARRLERTAEIGAHLFYKAPLLTASG